MATFLTEDIRNDFWLPVMIIDDDGFTHVICKLNTQRITMRPDRLRIEYILSKRFLPLVRQAAWMQAQKRSLRSKGHSPKRAASAISALSSLSGSPVRSSCTASLVVMASTGRAIVLAGKIVALRVVMSRAAFGPPCINGSRSPTRYASSITIRQALSPNVSLHSVLSACNPTSGGGWPVNCVIMSRIC